MVKQLDRNGAATSSARRKQLHPRADRTMQSQRELRDLGLTVEPDAAPSDGTVGEPAVTTVGDSR